MITTPAPKRGLVSDDLGGHDGTKAAHRDTFGTGIVRTSFSYLLRNQSNATSHATDERRWFV